MGEGGGGGRRFRIASARHRLRVRAAGCSGPMAARLAILKAARQLAVEAGVYVHVRKFSVINEVRL